MPRSALATTVITTHPHGQRVAHPTDYWWWPACYWRIDEIDGRSNIIKGNAWMFTPPPVKGRACFTAETPVWVDGVLVPISQVGLAQEVEGACSDAVRRFSQYPYGHSANGANTVEQLQEHQGMFTCYDVFLETGSCITAASNHYFVSDCGRWIALQDLRAGTELRAATGSVTVAAVYKRLRPYVGKVYNLKIKDSDRYLVGRDALIARDY